MILRAVEAGEGQGPPLVLAHGLFGQAANFAAVQKRLAGHRRVIALDLRNHGRSPHAVAMGYAEMAGDLLETLRAMDALPCVLAGHSMGGKAAMVAALLAPDAIARLFVGDIAPVVYPPHFRGFAAAMQAIPLAAGLSRRPADAALAGAVPEPAIRAFLLQNLVFGAEPAWRIGLDEIAAGLPGIEGWPALDAPPYAGPALFVAGERSDYILPAHRPAIRALFPRARFVKLKDAGHWLHADNPDGFTALLDAFASQ